uniref:Ig-like domain-containing protein n=1 Tax=Oreochromis niloticus TaxID=8128 RepID=A0A669BER3_ORENI
CLSSQHTEGNVGTKSEEKLIELIPLIISCSREKHIWKHIYVFLTPGLKWHSAGVVRPTLTVLPPSKEEDKQSSATVVCLATGGFPSNWKLGWTVGGTSTSSGVSTSLEVLGTDGRYSWSSTLSLSADQWRKAGSVSCEASLSGQSPVTQTLDPDHCSE